MKKTIHFDDGTEKIAWRGHVSRQADTGDVLEQPSKYRARRHLHKAAYGTMHSAPQLVPLAPPQSRSAMPRKPHRQVINS